MSSSHDLLIGVASGGICVILVGVLTAALRHWLGQLQRSVNIGVQQTSQLERNGGSSVRDAIDRIEAAQADARTEAKEVRALAIAHGLQLAVVTTRLDEHIRVVRERDAASTSVAAAAALQAHDERSANTREIIAGQS